VGRNGSGKTSLFRALAGFLRFEGYVKVGGADVTRLPVERRGIVMVTPSSSFPHLAVDSHLTWGARLNGRSPSPEALSRAKSELGIDFGGPVRNLSLGMRGRVSLATALFASPKVILVDEVFSTLHDKDEFIPTYGRLASDSGIVLVFSSQNDADGRLAGEVYVMNNGSAARQT
jgi:molybdate/tungstate transport system ATP-binding protein